MAVEAALSDLRVCSSPACYRRWRHYFGSLCVEVTWLARSQATPVLICSSDWVFAEKNRQDGNISEAGFQYYLQLRSRMLQNLPRPHDLIFLDVSPEVCYARVHTVRQRVSYSCLVSLTCCRSAKAAFHLNTCAALTAAIANGLRGCAAKAPR
jgi:hypothetical protein